MAWLYVVAALVFGVVFYGFNLRNRWRYRHIPGPAPTWLLGNMREVGKEGLHNLLPQWAETYGPVYKFFFGRFPFVVINDPELVRQVCVKNFMQFHDRQYNLIHQGGTNQEANCTFLYGILSAKGKYWAGLRSSVEPVFHSQQLIRYAPMMNEAAEKLAQRMAAFAEQQQNGTAARSDAAQGAAAPAADCTGDADVAAAAAGKVTSMQLQPALGTTALEVVGTSAFGVEFDTDKEESRIVKEASFVMTPPKQPQNLNRMGGILIPHLGRFWFLISSWMGSESVKGSFTARGFLLGTAQVLLENARRSGTGTATETADGSKADTSATGTDTAATAEATPLVKPAGNVTAATVPPISHLPGGSQQSPWRLLHRGDPDLHLYNQAKADAHQEYGTAVPKDYSILHHLLRATNKETGQPFTDLQIVAQSNTFLLAGFDTTSTALTWAVYALATHPEIQQRLLQEVDAFSWKDGAGVGFEDLSHFEFTRAVIDEAMRMWPPVMPMVGLQREANVDTSIGEYAVPKGTKIWINVLSLHHDPRNFPEPKVFRPERFLPGSQEAASRHPFAYIPFGNGPRKCVGYKFALEEAVITLAQLYRRFTFELDPEKHPDTSAPLQLHSGITLTMKNGVWVRPLPRT